jgi:ABC-type multidrug transport system ATPase subunit
MLPLLAKSFLPLQATVMMSLLQPAPEVFELFDDVLLLSEGQVVYHGPREQVMPFFHSLGFAIPARKGIADFLQEVTSRKVRRLLAMPILGAWNLVPP